MSGPAGRGRRVLFVHNNFPGQFGAVAEAAVAAGWSAAAIGCHTARGVAGVETIRWTVDPSAVRAAGTLAARAEVDTLRGLAAARAAEEWRRRGFVPDLVVGHPGWGETLFLGEVFPDARQISYAEFFYRSRGADVNFDPEFASTAPETGYRVHAKNMGLALAYATADRIVAPTPFQASLLPAVFADRTRIIHEGVDTALVRRRTGVDLRLDDRRLDGSSPVVTFVNRHFEPMRGFHVMMRALPKLIAAVPEVTVLMVGEDAARGYGAEAGDGRTWRSVMAAEIAGRADLSRVHFVGRVPCPTLLSIYSISTAHVYYTYPFVLSWSLLEAMACECLVIGSATPPVLDVLEPGVNGLALDFFDPDALAEALIGACRDPALRPRLGPAARRTVVERFDRATRALPDWLALMDETAG